MLVSLENMYYYKRKTYYDVRYDNGPISSLALSTDPIVCWKLSELFPCYRHNLPIMHSGDVSRHPGEVLLRRAVTMSGANRFYGRYSYRTETSYRDITITRRHRYYAILFFIPFDVVISGERVTLFYNFCNVLLIYHSLY